MWFVATVIKQKMLGSVALTAVSQQKSRCRLFRLPTDKIVPRVTIHHCVDVDIALCVTGVSVRCQSEAFVLA